jgi:hypothetical protein
VPALKHEALSSNPSPTKRKKKRIKLCHLQVNGRGDHHVKQGKPGSERPQAFSHMCKINPKGKRLHKYKHDHTHTPGLQTVRLFEGIREKKERKRE